MNSTTWAKRNAAAFAVGILVVVGLFAWAVNAWAIPRGDGKVGADVTFITGPIGELAVPGGAFLRGTDLRPGGPSAAGSIPVRNQTGGPLDVTVQALPSIRDLDTLLSVEVSAGSRAVYRGPLSGLEVGSNPLRLAAGHTQILDVRVWLPASVRDGYQNRIDDVTLAFDVRPARA
ncbi:MAG: hypothetical protein M3Q23_17685 [Actinomycetota bacterium]|nr:hypothetical protein [Actinomycetota bacterium]